MTDDTGSFASWGAYQQAKYEAQKENAQQQRQLDRELNPKQPRPKMTPEQKLEANRESQRRFRERKRQELKDRGEYSPPNSQKTHCSTCGEPYDEANTYCEADGSRRCRNCHNNRVKEAYAADPEAGRQRSRDKQAKHGAKWNQQKREQRAADPEGTRAKDNARYRENPEPKRRRIWRGRHGLSPDQWDELWEQQEGCCYLCGGKLPEPTEALMKVSGSWGRPHLDHDHRCCPPNKSCAVCRRGIACPSCNTAIGQARDDPVRLRRMADALEAAQAIVEVRMKVARGSGAGFPMLRSPDAGSLRSG